MTDIVVMWYCFDKFTFISSAMYCYLQFVECCDVWIALWPARLWCYTVSD